MKAETTFELVGELIGVDAVIVGPSGSAQLTLVLDTAAVLTTVVPSIAESVGYSAAQRESWSVSRTAAAEERVYIVRAEISCLGFDDSSSDGYEPVIPRARSDTRRP